MAMNPIQFRPGLSMLDRRRSTFRRGRQVYYQCRACRHPVLRHQTAVAHLVRRDLRPHRDLDQRRRN